MVGGLPETVTENDGGKTDQMKRGVKGNHSYKHYSKVKGVIERGDGE